MYNKIISNTKINLDKQQYLTLTEFDDLHEDEPEVAIEYAIDLYKT